MRTIALFIFASLTFVAACQAEQPQVLPVHTEPLIVRSAVGDQKAAFDIEIAETEAQRSMGLMHRIDLPSDRGMLFVFPDVGLRYFWMQNTPTALDIIYADADGMIVSIAQNTVPFSTQPIPSLQPAKFAFEVVAGSSERLGIVSGDVLVHPAIVE